MLAQYNQVVEGAAERILGMAERQEAHRHDLERTVIHGDARRSDRGLWCGAVLVAFSLLAGFVLVVLDHDLAGAIFVGSGMTTMAAVFVFGTRARTRERERRARLMTQEPERSERH